MLYSILIYAAEGVFDRLPPEEQEAILQKHNDLQEELEKRGTFAVARLMPVTSAVTLRPSQAKDADPIVVDGPFAETKERFAGFYVVDCDTLEDAIALGGRLATSHDAIEVRPIAWAGGTLGPS